MSKQRVIVFYDVTENKRRTKLNKVLESYGIRIQRSGFECILTIYQYQELLEKIEKTINKDEDIIKIIKLHEESQITDFGEYKKVENEEFDII